jgi:hypothetical protein
VVDEAIGVAVREVAAPVHPAAHTLRSGGLVVVVAGELAGAGGVHQLVGGLFEVGHLTGGVEDSPRALLTGRGIEHGHTLDRHTERSVRRAGDTGDHHGVLGRAEPVDHQAAEPLGERPDVAVAGFVAEGDAQRVVELVGARRCGST